MDVRVNKFVWVDALRGLAVLGVILMHTGGFGLGTTGLPLKLSNLIYDGARGVQLFYVMSAFTLFYTYSIHSKRELHRIKNFFTRRFFRIAPLFYIVIAYYFIIDGWGSRYPGGASSVDIFTLLSTITFTNGFHPHWINSLVPGGWSIAVEMAFYCTVPFLAAHVTNLRQWAAAFAIVLAIKAISSYCLTQFVITFHPTNEWNEFLFFWLPTQLPAFMFGILLYLIVCKDALGSLSAKTQGTIGISAVLFLFVNHYYRTNYPFVNNIDPAALEVCAFFFLLSLSLSRLPGNLPPMKLLSFLGKLSFSMYLLHFAVLRWLMKLGWLDFLPVTGKFPASVNFVLRFTIVCTITAALAYITYKCIEKPCIAIGGKLILQREAAAKPSPAITPESA